MYVMTSLKCRPVMKFDPTPLIRPNFYDHGPLVTILTGFHCKIERYIFFLSRDYDD